MTCVEPDGQVKPAWGVLGAADHGVPAVGEMLEKGSCDSHVIPWEREKLFGMLD